MPNTIENSDINEHPRNNNNDNATAQDDTMSNSNKHECASKRDDDYASSARRSSSSCCLHPQLCWTPRTTGRLEASEWQVTISNFQFWSCVAIMLCVWAPLHRTELVCTFSDTVGISYGIAFIIVGKCQQSRCAGPVQSCCYRWQVSAGNIH